MNNEIKKMKKLIFIIFFIALFYSCNDEERIVDNTSSDIQVLIADEDEAILRLVDLNSNTVINENILSQIENHQFSSPVSQIKRYLGKLFIVIPEDMKIVIIEEVGLKLISVIDYSDIALKPFSIEFANATTAYVIHSESNKISILDITDSDSFVGYKIARQIEVGQLPTDIAIRGNQIMVTNSGDNTVSILDTRTNAVEKTLTTFPVPYLVDYIPGQDEAIIVCKGEGKNNSNPTSAAYVQYIDLNANEITQSQLLNVDDGANADEINPEYLITTEEEWGFVLANDQLIRIDLRTKENIKLIIFQPFFFLEANLNSQQLLMVGEGRDGQRELYLGDINTGNPQTTYDLPENSKIVFLL